jgi:hypothetical protein
MSETRLFCREAGDSYEALLTATAMEKCGGEVISVTYDGQHQRPGAMIPCSKFVVFCRIAKGYDLDVVDRIIAAALFPEQQPKDKP